MCSVHLLRCFRVGPRRGTARSEHRGVGDAREQSGRFTVGYNVREVSFSSVILLQVRKQNLGAQGPKESHGHIGGFM